MTKNYFTKRVLTFLVLTGSIMDIGAAQDVAPALTLQGLDHSVPQGIRARAMGGAAYGTMGEATVLFSNPAGLTSIDRIEVRIGGAYSKQNSRSSQEWYGDSNHPLYSLVVENKPEYWPLFDSLNVKFANDLTRVLRGRPFNIHPYDALQTGWEKDQNRYFPTLVAAAIPFDLTGVKVVGAIGYAELINLDSYFQNNTAQNPYLGLFRPAPMPVFQTFPDTQRIHLFQFITERKGSIYGITPAVAFSLFAGVNLGVSATIIKGISDDREEYHERSQILFYTLKTSTKIDPLFQLDNIVYDRVSTGTSDYSGTMLNIGLNLSSKYINIGASMKPAWTMTREWKRETIVTTLDSAQVFANTSTPEAGKERIDFPASYGVGIAIHASKRTTLTVDYEDKNLNSVTYRSTDTTASQPWLNAKRLRFGIEYLAVDWLALRGGFREEAQTYASAGAAIMDEPERAQVYTAGVGLKFGNVSFDVAYEYCKIKFQDMWVTNVNYNSRSAHTLTVEIGYQF